MTRCQDCGKPAENYALPDDTWQMVAPASRFWLCLKHFVKRCNKRLEEGARWQKQVLRSRHED